MSPRKQELAVTLPSGKRARVWDARPGEPALSDDRVDGKRTFGGRMLRAIETGRLGLAIEGEPDVGSLLLPDYHALRDAAFRLGVIAEDPDPDLRCRNCEAALSPGPEDAPLEDLDLWYVEHPTESLSQPLPLGQALRLPNGGRAETFEMTPVTVAQAKPLWRAVERRDVRIGPKLVGALGLRALGEVTEPSVIARALDEAPDEVWAVIETAFVLLNYAPRSHFPYVCPECGALHDMLAPATRELDLDLDAEAMLLGEALPDRDVEHAPFPDEEAFAEMAIRIGKEVYRERGVAHIELVVDLGVPPVDGSGEPLLGSYRPIAEGDQAGYTDLRFQIDVFYKTFESMYADAPYDIEAELRETIDHEVEHHLHHLRGHDPMDEEEREEALEELRRTYGARAVRRAHVAGIFAELRTLAWFILAALIVVALIALYTVAR